MTTCQLTDSQLDALKEISNIGMGHAATALSQLMGKTIHLQVPRVLLMDIARVPEMFGGAERMVVGIFLQILGNARGNILLVIPRENAIRILEKLLPQNRLRGNILTELEFSALKEVGNILASAFLNALGDLLRMTLIPSVPVLSLDMAGAVIDHVLIDLAAAGESSLLVEAEFSGDDEQLSGHFFLLPDPASLEIIMGAVGV